MQRKIQVTDITEFLASRDAFDSVIDVRSPSEFADDHIPGAINLPVLDDDERAEVGTIYKQVDPFTARKRGASLTSRNIATHIETLSQNPKDWRPVVYCWRGGQRSGSMALVMHEVGWPVTLVEGGYKAYRRYIQEQLDSMLKRIRLIIRTRLDIRSLILRPWQVIEAHFLARSPVSRSHHKSYLNLASITRFLNLI